MSFTVTYADAGINRHEFDAYVRLLEKRGIDWSNTPRVPEPGTSNRWLYVWSDQGQAEEFCEELKQETRDDSWYVRELPPETRPSSGPLTHVIIRMRRNSLGADFSLHPHSQTLIRRRFPNARRVSNISIEWKTREDFEREHGPIWDHVAAVLTGLSLEQLASLDGYEVYDVRAERTIYSSQAAAAV